MDMYTREWIAPHRLININTDHEAKARSLPVWELVITKSKIEGSCAKSITETPPSTFVTIASRFASGLRPPGVAAPGVVTPGVLNPPLLISCAEFD